MTSKKDSSKDGGGHDFDRRENSLEQVRKRLRSGWRHDPEILDQYFQSCYNNWKVYTGVRTPKQVLKLQAIYKQGVYGDNEELPPDNMESVEGEKWKAWAKLRGTPKEMAKRRFITFLAEIDPLLIDVMPDEKPPIGFPLDRRGNAICAKCNTVVGCIRPIVDQYKMPVKQMLFDNEEFHEPEKLKAWIRSTLANQRCVWGMHMPITRAEARPFMDWFNRDENRGFYPYDSAPIMNMIKEVVTNYHQMAQEMMEDKEKPESETYNAVAIKCYKLKEVFESFSGEDYRFEVFCTRENESCNQRRIADGGKNHKHEYIIDPPTKTDSNAMEEAIMLRKQCQRLGINPSTGVVKTLQERCEIYRQRIAEHFAALKRATEAKARNDNRAIVHKSEKDTVIALSKEMLQRQMWDACQENLIDNIMVLAKRGSNVNEESPRGLTPLICMVVNEAVVEKIEMLINTYSADINQPNKFGLTPLMMACRTKDMKMVHVLMRNGASALQKGYNGQTALHVCAIQGSEEIARTLVDYLKDGVGDSMRVTRFLDAMDDNGDTALIVAARRRNGILCYTLCSLGCNPGIRNSTGRTAGYVARSKTWNEICDWLDKKVGTGANRIETFSDLEFEKKCRFGLIKTRELLQNFARNYLLLIQNRLGLHPLGTPYKAKSMVDERGERARKEQRKFMDSHFRYILRRYPEQYPSLLASLPASYHNEAHQDHLLSDTELEERMDDLRNTVAEMVKLIRLGYTYPNTDIAAQPIAWTPMMCAVAINDSRSIKILYREGGDPNFPNKEGTTPVMLAAQLHHNQAIVDLLTIGGDLYATDNMGYTALAYSTSLPLPTIMDRTYMDRMINDDISGPKLLSSEEIIKAAMSEIPQVDVNQQKDKDHDRPAGKIGGPIGGPLQTATDHLKDLLNKNENEASPENIETQSKFLQLLHQFGLTPVREEANIDYQLKSTKWRITEKEEKDNDEDLQEKGKDGKNKDDEDDDIIEDTAEGGEARRKFDEEQERIRKEKEEYLKKMDPNILRCPICTLVPPCPHFFKIGSLLSFIKENESVKVVGSDQRSATSIRMARKVKMKNRAQEVLEETEIHDRGTDRSATLAKKYQEREKFLEKARAQRFQEAKSQQELEELERADYAAFVEEARRNGELEDSDDEDENTNNHAEELFEMPSKSSSPGKSTSAAARTSSHDTSSNAPSDIADTPADSEHKEKAKEEGLATRVEMDNDEDVYDNLPGSAGGLPLVKEGDFTPEMALVVVPVSILKQNVSGHSRRVRFNLPAGEGDEEEDEENVDSEGNAEGSGEKNRDGKEENRDSATADAEEDTAVVHKKKTPKKKASKSTKLRFSDDKAIKQSDKLSTQSTSVVLSWDESDEEKADTNSLESSKQTNSTQSQQNALVVVASNTSKKDDDSADEEDFESWYEEKEKKANEEISSELQLAYDVLTTGIVATDYKEKLYEKELRELKTEPSRIFPFNRDQPFGFHDGVYANMKDTMPMDANDTAAGHKDSDGSEEKTSSKPQLDDEAPFTPALEAAQRKVTLPGYLFVHLGDLHTATLPPVSMSLSQTAWINILEQLNSSFHQEWCDQLDLTVLIDHTSWAVSAPTCILCQIGYIRHKDTLRIYREDRVQFDTEKMRLLRKLFDPHTAASNPAEPAASHNQPQHHTSTTPDDEQALLPYLCFSCVLRRELYHRVLKTQPRSVRRTLHTRWPLLATHDPHFNHMPQTEHVDAMMNLHAIAPLPKVFPPLGQNFYQSQSQSTSYSKQNGGMTDSEMAMRRPMDFPATPNYNSTMFAAAEEHQMLVPVPGRSVSVEAAEASSPIAGERMSQAGFLTTLMGSISQSIDHRQLSEDNYSNHNNQVALIPEEFTILDHVDNVFEHDQSGHGSTHNGDFLSLVDYPFPPSAMVPHHDPQEMQPNMLPSNHDGADYFLPPSPIKSRKLRELDEMLARHLQRQLSEFNSQHEVVGEEDDVDDDVSQVSSLSQVSISYEKNWMLSALNNLAVSVSASVADKVLQQLASSNNSTNNSQHQPSVGTSVTVSTVSQVNPHKRPREMTLLPYYVAQGLFEDAERVVRILLGKEAIDEGEGYAFLLEILSQLAEVYKLSGLYLLSVSVYLDLLTRTISLCGWSDRLTLDVVLPSLLLCYRRMGLEDYAQALMKYSLQDLHQSLRKTGKVEVIKRLNKVQRNNVARFIKINSLWTKYLQMRLFYPAAQTESTSAVVKADGSSNASNTASNNNINDNNSSRNTNRIIKDSDVLTSRQHSTNHLDTHATATSSSSSSSSSGGGFVCGKPKKWHRFERLLGIVGVYVFYTSTVPVFVTQRRVFREYCHDMRRQYFLQQQILARWQRQKQRLLSQNTAEHADNHRHTHHANDQTDSTEEDKTQDRKNKTFVWKFTLPEIDAHIAKVQQDYPVPDRKYVSAETYEHLHIYINFIEVYFTIYQVEEPVIYRYLLQHLWRHFLCKSLMKTSPLPRLFRHVTSRAHILEIAYFFRFGKELSLSVFDAVVHEVLQLILPFYRRFFLHAEAGASYREHFLVTLTTTTDENSDANHTNTKNTANASATSHVYQPHPSTKNTNEGEGNEKEQEQKVEEEEEEEEEEDMTIPAVAEALDQAILMLQTVARAYLIRRNYVFGPAVRRRLLKMAQEEARLKEIAEQAKLQAARDLEIQAQREAKRKRQARLSVILPDAPVLPKRKHY